MKKFLNLLLVIVATTVVAQAQNLNAAKDLAKAKVIVMVNTAEWCPTCKANGARMESDIFPKFKSDKSYAFVINDLSNATSKATSNKTLSSMGLTSLASKNKGTGVIYFIDPMTRKVKSKISVAESNEAIKAAFAKAI